MATRNPAAAPVFWPGVVACFLGVAYTLGITIHYPLSVSPDGVSYPELAAHLMEGLGPRTIDETGSLQVVTHWPPLYPLCLAGLSFVLGVEPLVAARILAALCLGTSMLFLDRILVRFDPSAAVRCLCLSLLFTSLPFVIYTRAISEGLFITLLLAFTLCLVRFEESGRRSALVLAGVIGGLMFLSRYAAVGFLAGAALFLITRSAPFGKRLEHLAMLFVPALLIGSTWLAYTLIEGTNPSNRTLAFHFVSYNHLVILAKTVLLWLSPALPYSGFVVLALLAGLGAMLARMRPSLALRDLPAAFPLLAWLSATYILFLVFSVTFVDYHTQFNYRILAPVFPFVVFMSLPFWQWAFTTLSARRLATGILVLIGISYLWAFTMRSEDVFRNGHYYTSGAWLNSPTLVHLGSVPTQKRVYTNGPDPIRLWKGYRPAVVRLPTRVEVTSHTANTDFERQMQNLHEQLRAGEAVVIYFDAIYRPYLPNAAILKARFADIPVREFGDGFAMGRGTP